MDNIERAVCISDLHIPFQDKTAVQLVLKFISQFKPDYVFLNGDIIDCWEISRFDKPLFIDSRLKDEICATVIFFDELRQASPNSRIIYIYGNHEFRFERFIAKNARELAGLMGLTLKEQLCVATFGIETVDSHQKENFYRFGQHLIIGHFNKVNKNSGYTAKNLLEEKGISVIQGHTHRLGSSYKRDFEGVKGGWEGGCLCDLNPPYIQLPNWMQGFITIHKDKKTDFFKVTPVEIIEGRCFYGDKIIAL
jgi:UDP-2,3-diacylglucosamine pyrophosphatase LpxH